MKKSVLISKVSKILSRLNDDNYNDSDIELFFVTLREMPSATKSIIEIGDFVAHSEQRNKGVINEIMLRNSLLANIVSGYDHQVVNKDRNEYPQNFPTLIKLQLKMYNDAEIKANIGLAGGMIKRIRTKLNDKKSYIRDGDICRLAENIGTDEFLVIDFILSFLNGSDGISFELLINEVVALLKMEIPGVDASIIEDKKKCVFCVLLCLLNNVQYPLLTGSVAETIIAADDSDGRVHIMGKYAVDGPQKNVFIMSVVFHSEYKMVDVFREDVTVVDIQQGNIEYCTKIGKIVRRDV
ncbi:hypothetical protein CRR46_08530 [Salmonella enterica]|uniref:Uncharacterized protein n=1 Tax=Salmonella enterica TaxID=28901 RepID=A0A5V3MS08_SALER|nr:hypothetical protein [Salmonella enterica]ECF1476688.1 hypothetical protein [Salmonella enterica subsp. enterica serovar Newport]EBD7697374.1 hypothetical protein [Salmonella enterica]EBK3212291.1 hypothetical protein [Salmonella enterica]EBR5971404.1 hypothetical protein [Salmonella enterica]